MNQAPNTQVRRDADTSAQDAIFLYELAEAITAASDYQGIVDAVARLQPDADGVFLNFYEHLDDRRATYVEMQAIAAVSPAIEGLYKPRIPKLPIFDFIRDDPLWVSSDIYADQRFDAAMLAVMRSLPTKALMGVPLHSGERIWGVIVFNYARPRDFSARERQLALNVGNLVATAVERLRLTQETAAAIEAQRAALLAEQQAREDLSLLYQAAEAINAATTFQSIMHALAPLTRDVEKLYLVLWEHLDFRKATYFEMTAGLTTSGEVPRSVGTRSTPAQFPIAIRTQHSRQTVIEDINDHPLVDPVTRAGWAADGIRALMLVNLIQDGRWYGVLSFESSTPRQYSERDRRLTLAISDLALSAVIRIQAQHELALAAESQRLALLSEQASRQEITLLYQVSQAINQATSMTEVLHATKQVFPDPLDVAIFAWDGYDRTNAAYLEVLASSDVNLPTGLRLPHDLLAGAMALDPSQFVVANDVNSPEWRDNRATDSARFFGLHSITFSNLLHSQRVLGLFAIASYAPYTFSEQEVRLVTAIAGLTVAAMERFRSRQAEEDASHEREQLFRASQAINAANSFHEILSAVSHIDLDGGDYYLYTFENFDYLTATYIETVATAKGQFMSEGERIPLDKLPFLKTHPRPGLVVYEDVPHHPALDPVTKATMAAQGVVSNLRFGLVWQNRSLGAFGIDHGALKRYTPREIRMMNALGELIAAAVERIRLQWETHAARVKAERLAEQAQQLAALEERTRLARELHDSVSQALYGIGLGAQTARRLLSEDPARVHEPVEYIFSLATAGLAEMRALIFELRPESLETEGLILALAKQASSLQARHGITVQTVFCDEPPLPLAAKESLYRVVREALHNVVKHAGASLVTLTVESDDAALQVTVTDDGVGFDTTREFPGHLGLRSMQERMAQLNGSCAIRSTLGQGAQLTFSLPLREL